MTFRLFAPSRWVERQPNSTVGVVDLAEDRPGTGARQLRGVRIDSLTVIDRGLLEWARQGSILGVTVVGDRLVLTLTNGTWAYQVGDYSDHYSAHLLHLIEGRPLAPGS